MNDLISILWRTLEQLTKNSTNELLPLYFRKRQDMVCLVSIKKGTPQVLVDQALLEAYERVDSEIIKSYMVNEDKFKVFLSARNAFINNDFVSLNSVSVAVHGPLVAPHRGTHAYNVNVEYSFLRSKIYELLYELLPNDWMIEEKWVSIKEVATILSTATQKSTSLMGSVAEVSHAFVLPSSNKQNTEEDCIEISPESASLAQGWLYSQQMREWRLAKSMTQMQAANLIGCTPAAWGNWERGVFTPTSIFRRKIEDLLNIDCLGDNRADVPTITQTLSRRRHSRSRSLSYLDGNRRLLEHLANFGELTLSDMEELGLDETHLINWLDSLLTRRPKAYVATPLFFYLIDGDVSPTGFTTRLAAYFMGEHLRRHTLEPISELEEHVWERFGRWHLTPPHSAEQKIYIYHDIPIQEPRDVAASERLDLFARLPPKIIRDLIREPDFLSEQQSWSADAASKSSEGPISTQLRRSWKRPLLLSTRKLLVADDGQVLIGEMDRINVTERSYIIAGLPICCDDEWEHAITLEREVAAARLFQHPVAAVLLQFEVHRLFAGLSGDVAAQIYVGGAVAELELGGLMRGPLWRHVRSMLEQVGYWPVGASTQDSLWATAVHEMLKNFELLDVFERNGDVLRLTDNYQSKIKSHPGHQQNRGEKLYRIRLSQFLEALHGGQR